MDRVEISRAIIYTHSHATEDLDKVKQAIYNILPPNLKNRITIEQETIEGYYKNIIYRLKVILERDDAIEFVRNLLNLMSKTDKDTLINTIEIRYNRKSNEIYIRLNKQDAYLGMITLYDGDDAIKIVITFTHKRSLEDIRKLMESLAKGYVNAY